MMYKEAKDFLRFAKSLGVRSLKFDGLEVDFGLENSVVSNKKVKDSVKKREDIAESTLKQQELEHKQMQIDELLLSNPEEYERLVGQEELLNEKTHDTRTQ